MSRLIDRIKEVIHEWKPAGHSIDGGSARAFPPIKPPINPKDPIPVPKPIKPKEEDK